MLQAVALLSLLTSTALAQTHFTGLSSTCLQFIKGFDNDSSLKTCSSSLANATAAYGTAKDSSKTFTKDEITSTLNSICNNDFGCTATLIKSKLGDFNKACTNELTSNNAEVTALYDAIYISVPMKEAICGKDDAGNLCALRTSAAVQAQPSLLTTLQQYLWNNPSLSKRGDDYATPNMSTVASSGLPFLFINPTLEYNVLCTACTRNTMGKYMNWQSDFPYAPGLTSSQALKGETDLYNGITKTCGAQFLSGNLQAAGGLGKGSGSSPSNGSLKAFGIDLITVFIGAITMAFATSL